MRAPKYKASFLALVAVLATSLMGAAYALWYEELTLTATVSTGTLEGAITCGAVLDNENAGWPSPPFPPPPFPPFDSYPEANPLKNVASDALSNGTFPFHEWTITVNNAYPGYAFDCEVHILNSGTVPWHIERQWIEITGPGGYSLITECNGPFNQPCPAGTLGINTAAPVFAEFFLNWEGCQIHGPTGQMNQSVFVGINQPAQENATYTIKFKFTVNQWNESAWDGCGDPRGSFAPSSGGGGLSALLPGHSFEPQYSEIQG